MQDVADALDNIVNDKPGAYTPEIFDNAAKQWASFSLDTYTGKLLRRALDISVAMSEFTAEIEH